MTVTKLSPTDLAKWIEKDAKDLMDFKHETFKLRTLINTATTNLNILLTNQALCSKKSPDRYMKINSETEIILEWIKVNTVNLSQLMDTRQQQTIILNNANKGL